ncbi:MAG: prepilin-type N-terminal cleavage/methylation domain-containing protein [Candidatus Zixiibacteriota bacterium]|nr:MAG: prepilin-type N-terminal cleavage/methylation domain-containing protein [candidate division Zixibacteria bacterium]
MSICTDNRAFTLIELVLVIVIIGILVTVAIRSGQHIVDSSRTEETKQELEVLARATIGNPALENNGIRSDFGYVGDIGSLPPDLDALVSNPGGYGTWKGPYIGNRFEQAAEDYKRDAWGSLYSYSGGVTITSSGSGSNIMHKFASSTSSLLSNSVGGIVLDVDDTPPGSTFKDYVVLRLTFPDGSGGTTTSTTSPDIGGHFEFSSIPIGNHRIEIIYTPYNDTMTRFVSVAPDSRVYSQYNLGTNVWTGPGGLEYVDGSITVIGGADCNRLRFEIENTWGIPIDVSSMTVTWSTPTAYYERIRFATVWVYESNDPRTASGQLATFTSTQTLAPGEIQVIHIEDFSQNQTGGAIPAEMNWVDVTFSFSDGSSFTINTGAGAC